MEKIVVKEILCLNRKISNVLHKLERKSNTIKSLYSVSVCPKILQLIQQQHCPKISQLLQRVRRTVKPLYSDNICPKILQLLQWQRRPKISQLLQRVVQSNFFILTTSVRKFHSCYNGSVYPTISYKEQYNQISLQ